MRYTLSELRERGKRFLEEDREEDTEEELKVAERQYRRRMLLIHLKSMGVDVSNPEFESLDTKCGPAFILDDEVRVVYVRSQDKKKLVQGIGEHLRLYLSSKGLKAKSPIVHLDTVRPHQEFCQMLHALRS